MISGDNISVIIVFDNLELSGADKIAINLLNNKVYFRHVEMNGVVCMENKLGNALSNDSIIMLQKNKKQSRTLLNRLIDAILIIPKLRAATRGDHILIATTPPAAVFCWIASLGRKSIVVPWVHYDFIGYQRDAWPPGNYIRGKIQGILHFAIVPRFKRIIFVSRQCLNSFPPLVSGIKGWRVLPNVFDSRSFIPDANSAALEKIQNLKGKDGPTLVFLGRIFRQKRWEDALRVMEILEESNFKANLVVIGDGIEREEFLSHLERNQSRDRIHFVGADKNAAAALALADGLILTSLFEAWPTVILEAFAARVPVFSYDCPSGPREMLGDGARGVLTDENPEALATAIVKFFRTSADYRESLIENGQEFLKGFMPETAMALWERELAEIWESIHVPRGD